MKRNKEIEKKSEKIGKKSSTATFEHHTRMHYFTLVRETCLCVRSTWRESGLKALLFSTRGAAIAAAANVLCKRIGAAYEKLQASSGGRLIALRSRRDE